MTLPLGFQDWMPASQALSIALLTFVQEDIPTVSAAVLAAAGTLPWQVGWLGSFLGIWVGDALLYLIARLVGRPLIDQRWARRFCSPAAVSRAEEWFARRGTELLITSRFVPGTRLATYLAAGFLRVPWTRFLVITGVAVGLWTAAIFLIVQFFGPDLLRRIGGWTIPVIVGALLLGRSLRVAFRRWEFWPAWLFYIPVAANYLRLAMKYGGFTLPTAANPGMFSGGMVGESKLVTLQELFATSPDLTAEAELFNGAPRFEYPFILKPDVGQRGAGVKLIWTAEQAQAYQKRATAPLIIQRYAPGPYEVGIFYYRFPYTARGRIFAITEKLFPTITGDGHRTIEQLIRSDKRARFLAARYLERFAKRRDEVLQAGESLKLVEAGNHAQGCIFQDGWHLWSRELESRIDEISQRLTGFFIGRYDIRYACDADLRAGRKFQIVELNGASAEATSIYDTRNSVVAAYRTLVRQWELVFAIGAANRVRGFATTPFRVIVRKWRENMSRTHPIAD